MDSEAADKIVTLREGFRYKDMPLEVQKEFDKLARKYASASLAGDRWEKKDRAAKEIEDYTEAKRCIKNAIKYKKKELAIYEALYEKYGQHDSDKSPSTILLKLISKNFNLDQIKNRELVTQTCIVLEKQAKEMGVDIKPLFFESMQIERMLSRGIESLGIKPRKQEITEEDRLYNLLTHFIVFLQSQQKGVDPRWLLHEMFKDDLDDHDENEDQPML